jgi:hypothetical protein
VSLRSKDYVTVTCAEGYIRAKARLMKNVAAPHALHAN